MLADRHAGQYDSSRTYPDTVPDDNGFGIYVTPNGRLLRVVFSNEQHSRPYEHTVFQCNTAPVEEGTTEIYEHTPADTGKLTEVGIERRKHTYRFVQWLSPNTAEQIPYLFRCMVTAIELSHQLHRLLEFCIERRIFRVGIENQFPRPHSFQYIHTIHIFYKAKLHRPHLPVSI